MKLLKITTCFFVVLFNCYSALSAPVITGMNGIIRNNESISIVGTGFTDKKNAGPIISSYNNESPGNNWSAGTVAGSWTVRDDDDTLRLTNTFARSPFDQSSYNIIYDASGGYNSIRYQHDTPERTIYVSFWMYRDSATLDLSGTELNSKFFRIYNSTNVGDANLVWSVVDRESIDSDIYKSYMSGDYLGTASWKLDYSASVCNGSMGNSSIFFSQSKETLCKPVMRKWEHYEILINYPSSLGTPDGKILQLKDGATFARSSGIMIGEEGQNETMRFPMFGQVSGGRNHSYHEYIDQVYIDNTPAHIYLSDSSSAVWPDIDHFNHTEIQVASEWSDNSITFTLNQGTFAEGQTVYLYVVDINGESNISGYPVVIGNNSNQSDMSPEINITNPADSQIITSNNYLSLTGTSSDDNGVTSINWSNSRGGSGTVSGDLNAWSITGITLLEGENVITVTALDSANQSSSVSVTVTYTPAITAPMAPGASAVISAVGNQISMSWDSFGGASVVNYRILRNGSEVLSTSERSYVDSNLAALTTYTYTIVALDGSGDNLGEIVLSAKTE